MYCSICYVWMYSLLCVVAVKRKTLADCQSTIVGRPLNKYALSVIFIIECTNILFVQTICCKNMIYFCTMTSCIVHV